MCPGQPPQYVFGRDSSVEEPWYKAKSSYVADGKSTLSTALYDNSTLPDSQKSSSGSGTTPLDRLSTVQTFLSSKGNQQSRLTILDGLIASKRRSCSVLQADVQNRESLYNEALLLTRNNLRILNEKYQGQMLELDRIEKAVQAWERHRMSSPNLVFQKRR